jgi:hypothetical protein
LSSDVGCKPLSRFRLSVHTWSPSVDLVMRRRANCSEETVVAFVPSAAPEDLLIGVRRNAQIFPVVLHPSSGAVVLESGLAGDFMGEVQKFSIADRH